MTREEAIKALNEYGVLFPSDVEEAIDMAMEALARPKVAFLCDGRKCGNECSAMCFRTTDVSHAKNFMLLGDVYLEKEEKNDLDMIDRQTAIMAICRACSDDGEYYRNCKVYKNGMCVDILNLEKIQNDR